MNKCILMYKCLYNLAPCYLTDLFQTINSIHQYRTHRSNNLHVVKSKLEYYNRSFTITGAKSYETVYHKMSTTCQHYLLLSTHAKHTFLVKNRFNVIFYMFLYVILRFQPFNLCTYCKYYIVCMCECQMHVSAYPKQFFTTKCSRYRE